MKLCFIKLCNRGKFEVLQLRSVLSNHISSLLHGADRGKPEPTPKVFISHLQKPLSDKVSIEVNVVSEEEHFIFGIVLVDISSKDLKE